MKLTRALGYIEEPSGAGADYAWKVAAIGYASVLIPLVQLVLPRAEPVDWTWLALAWLAIGAGVAIGIVEELRTRRGEGRRSSDPLMTVLISLALLAGIFALGMAIAPDSGGLHWMLIIPPTIIATIGNRTMVAIVGGCSLLAMGTSIALTTSIDAIAPQLVTELAIATLVVLLVRAFAERVVHSIERDNLFGAMSEVAATADSLDEGWERVLPLVAHYLDATSISVGRIDDDSDSVVPLAVWPSTRSWSDVEAAVSSSRDDARNSFRFATIGERSVVPVTSADGLRLLVVADGMDTSVMGASYRDYRLSRVALQLDVLVNRVRMIEGLELLTRTDSLTNVHNRRSLMERLLHETRVAARTSEPLCAALVDLDHFKEFNDTFGHLEGDGALVAVAQLLTSRLRATDVVGRYGGEEFVIVLPQTVAGGAVRVLHELHERMRSLQLPRTVTFSAGIAQWDGFESIEALLGRADHALYLAKAAGRAQVIVADAANVAAPLLPTPPTRPPVTPTRTPTRTPPLTQPGSAFRYGATP